MASGVEHDRRAVSDEQAAAYRDRREALQAAAADLELEVDQLAAVATPDAARLRAALQGTKVRLDQHVAEAEAPGGLLAQILEDAAWLSARAEQLRSEHRELLDLADRALARAATAVDVEPLLPEARGLAARIAEHRHRGTTLLLDAYMLDLAPGD